jgi:hypothetical protein
VLLLQSLQYLSRSSANQFQQLQARSSKWHRMNVRRKKLPAATA